MTSRSSIILFSDRGRPYTISTQQINMYETFVSIDIRQCMRLQSITSCVWYCGDSGNAVSDSWTYNNTDASPAHYCYAAMPPCCLRMLLTCTSVRFLPKQHDVNFDLSLACGLWKWRNVSWLRTGIHLWRIAYPIVWLFKIIIWICNNMVILLKAYLCWLVITVLLENIMLVCNCLITLCHQVYCSC